MGRQLVESLASAGDNAGTPTNPASLASRDGSYAGESTSTAVGVVSLANATALSDARLEEMETENKTRDSLSFAVMESNSDDDGKSVTTAASKRPEGVLKEPSSETEALSKSILGLTPNQN